LSTLVRSRDSAAGETPPWAINTVKHPREETDDLFYFLEKIGQLWLQGIEIHWDAFYAGERRQRLSLPPYPFEPKRYRLEGDLLEIGAGLISRPPLQKKFARADWFYLPLWEESALPSRPAAAPAHLKWLLFIDTGGWGTRLAGKLAEMGQQVTVVRQGPAFEKLEEEDDRYGYLLDPGQGDSYDTLFRDLRESDRVPDHLVHLWNVERPGGSDDRPVPESLEESQDIGLYSLLNIVQALGRQSVTTRMEITAITTQMQQVTGDEAVRPEKATLLGAVKIIPLEYINIRCRSIDIAIPGPGSLEDKLVSLLLEELFGNSSDKAIAYRGLKRWVPVMKPQHLEAPGETDPRLKKHGVYLISGGFGGMGFTLAGFLASAYQAKLILVGRSPFPQRRQWEEWVDTHGPDDAVSRQIRKIRQWEEQGAEIEPARADISDFQEMSRVIARAKTRFGHIDGLLHTAGVIDWGGVIQKRTRQATEEVMAPKVRGTLVLDALLREEDLDFFVLFSSMGNVFYNIKFGEIGYAAANEFLDAFANSKSLADKTFTLAINWSDWLEVGMSAASARQQQGGKSDPIDYEAYSLDAVTPAEGVQVFRQILAHRYHRVGVATKDLDLLLEYLFRPPARPAPDEEAAPETFAGEDPDLSPRPELSTPCVDPGDNLEQQLAGLFRRYFGIRKIGIYDDFFELGGDSLKALTLSAKIHRLFRVEIPLPVFFRHPTISGLAQYIGKAVKSEVPAIMPTEEKEYYPLSSPQTRFYILQQIEPGSTLYNMPTLLVLETAPDKEKLESTFKALIRRHGSLRTSFTLHRDTPVQRISRNVEFAIQYCDLQAGTQPTHTDLETLVGNFIRPFDLAQPPLLRVRLIRTREDRYWLLLDLHHLVSDFGSQVILREDFQALGQGRELPALRLQYRDYAQWQNHEKTSARIKRQESYWLREFAGELPVLKLPTDFPRPAVQSFQGNTLHFRMDNRETRALKQIADKHKATLFMVFLALETVWLSKICGQEDLIIGVPLVGRSHADLEKLMGVFLNTLAIRSFPRGELTFREFLAEVRDKTLKAFANQDYGFEDLVEALKLKRDTSRNPLFDAAINFYNFQVKSGPANKIASETNGASGTDETNRINGTKATRGNHLEQSEQLDQVVARYGNDIAHNDLMLYMEQDGSGLKLSLEYCTKLFKQETLERWIDYFREVTAQVIEKESVKLTDLTISHELRKPEPGILQEDLEDFDF
jgi:NAD(P)-dependent dehydrogenase (short-subunit alcohol dehydrogenase family)/acyl carrier protein